jgi:hypothetical protein
MAQATAPKHRRDIRDVLVEIFQGSRELAKRLAAGTVAPYELGPFLGPAPKKTSSRDLLRNRQRRPGGRRRGLRLGKGPEEFWILSKKKFKGYWIAAEENQQGAVASGPLPFKRASRYRK